MNGSVEIDGRAVEWEFEEGLGFLRFGGIFAFRLPECLDEYAINAAVIAWHRGYQSGKEAGRSILQNDFRNLMGCQPR